MHKLALTEKMCCIDTQLSSCDHISQESWVIFWIMKYFVLNIYNAAYGNFSYNYTSSDVKLPLQLLMFVKQSAELSQLRILPFLFRDRKSVV